MRLAPACVCDTDPTPEEISIFNEMKYLLDDPLPDAVACRAKLALMFSDGLLPCEWDASAEMENYLLKENLISAECRLTRDEQVHLDHPPLILSFSLSLALFLSYIKSLFLDGRLIEMHDIFSYCATPHCSFEVNGYFGRKKTDWNERKRPSYC